MIPEINVPATDDNLNADQPSLTWKLDFDKGRVSGKIDQLEAVKQAVYKALQTDRYWYVIYSDDYGHELSTLIGDQPAFMQSELKRMVEEALMVDERIQSVDVLDITTNGDQLVFSFRVNSLFGSFDEEVSTNV
ncbi:hypothetical protein J40TS1_40230 [Paenibacillus montaniterrae]|uniref:DUF2634 domain-containing protein n=1 Tax=Paenibacillus montaniterrae TaxID=429341 RepID=A0A920CYZ6_9BACL|nr:DUF2634 domain-containing protein [Paenibacillus montaniterrae]GIP18381.1 hypothetical protein J40TS1_40230 [Paenibacillus montaniterrae]